MKFTSTEREFEEAGGALVHEVRPVKMLYDADGERERPICSATIDETDATGRSIQTRALRT